MFAVAGRSPAYEIFFLHKWTKISCFPVALYLFTGYSPFDSPQKPLIFYFFMKFFK